MSKLRDSIMKLTVTAPVYDTSGYAEASRTIVWGLLSRGCQIRILPRRWGILDANLPEPQRRALDALCAGQAWPEGPIIHIGIAQNFELIPGRINIGLTMLESDRLPAHWVRVCNQLEQVWVPSTFNRDTFSHSGVQAEKIKVVPIGVDTGRFHPAASPMDLGVPQDRFVFLSNFEWIPRKGYELLLQAYLAEFSADDPVVLVIKTYDGTHYDPGGHRMRETWRAMIEKLPVKKRPPLIEWLTEAKSASEMPAFYAAGDCYVIPTRGEGWNMPALEAMSSGLPVITTAWSGHLDYLNSENGYLIPIDRLEPIPLSGGPNDRIYEGAMWAVPSLSELRRLMRYAAGHRLEIKEKGKRARAEVVERWSTSPMLDRMLSLLAAWGVDSA